MFLYIWNNSNFSFQSNIKEISQANVKLYHTYLSTFFQFLKENDLTVVTPVICCNSIHIKGKKRLLCVILFQQFEGHLFEIVVITGKVW